MTKTVSEMQETACLEQSAGSNYELCRPLSPVCIPAARTQTFLSAAISFDIKYHY